MSCISRSSGWPNSERRADNGSVRHVASSDHEAWCAVLERLAMDAGLRGRRLLDVACGSGESFRPFLARGYTVTACDVSPRMVALAADPRAEVLVQDMRSLPVLGAHDLALCLHVQRNHPEPAVRRALAAAGLRLVRLGGMPPGVEVRDRFEELEDLKSVYVARRP